MRVARYLGGGQVAIVDEPEPGLPVGGLLVRTEACGLCSGELMDWYMDRKIPHVLGHEVAGIVEASDDERFPVGMRVFPHHHAPCLQCELCRAGLYVHCAQWKRTKLIPGGMAELFAVSAENLNDTLPANELRAIDAALIEPLACVVKSLFSAGPSDDCSRTAVIGLGVMGLMHMMLLPDATGYDLNPSRLEWAHKLGMTARHPREAQKAEVVFVCPGSKAALDQAIDMIEPGGTIILFAPMPPGEETPVDLNRLYFLDVKLVSSYSCGPDDTLAACEHLRRGNVRAEDVVSHFIEMAELPEAYAAMKAGTILKPMVVFS